MIKNINRFFAKFSLKKKKIIIKDNEQIIKNKL
jgi:hypothetical protein